MKNSTAFWITTLGYILCRWIIINVQHLKEFVTWESHVAVNAKYVMMCMDRSHAHSTGYELLSLSCILMLSVSIICVIIPVLYMTIKVVFKLNEILDAET